MKKVCIIGFLIAVGFLTNSTAIAALHTISIIDLPDPSGIEAYNIWFDVSDDFELVGPVSDGSAIPTAIDVGWTTDAEIVSTPLFKLAKSNLDGLLNNTQNNLLNGEITTFNYNGSIFGVNFFQFGDFMGSEVPITLVTHDQNQTVLSANAAPLPSALLLLGSGVVGIIGLRRKTVS